MTNDTTEITNSNLLNDQENISSNDKKYYEETINFSEKSKKIAINVFEELSKKSGSKCFNADDMELTKYQEKILLARLLTSEDDMRK